MVYLHCAGSADIPGHGGQEARLPRTEGEGDHPGEPGERRLPPGDWDERRVHVRGDGDALPAAQVEDSG